MSQFMGELRWILIVCGAILLVGIYFWGRRSGKQAAAADAALERGRAQPFSVRDQPVFAAEPRDEFEPLDNPADSEPSRFSEPGFDEPSGFSATDARLAPRHEVRYDAGDDDGEVADSYSPAASLATEEAARDIHTRDTRRARVEPTFNEPLISDDSFEDADQEAFEQEPSVREPHYEQRHESRGETRPEIRDESRSDAASSGSAAPTLAMSDTPSAPRRIERRKIIALRLAASSDRFAGRLLRQALEAEHLEHGKYQVFHRLHTDGVSIFSVASMVEPGTFDVEKMLGLSYAGITLFAQLPGPVQGVQALHDLVNCGKRLQESLGGTLQDDRGVPLTVHRIDRLRQEIVEFERAPGRDTAHRNSPPL